MGDRQFSSKIRLGETDNKFDVIMMNLDEDVILILPGHYTVTLTGWLTKTNNENTNVKYNINK